MEADAFIEVRFRTTEEGGRKGPVSGNFYACPMFIDGEGFDCRLQIKGMTLALGSTYYEIPLKFLNRDLALPKISIGKVVTLWEGKDVADCKVTKIIA